MDSLVRSLGIRARGGLLRGLGTRDSVRAIEHDDHSFERAMAPILKIACVRLITQSKRVEPIILRLFVAFYEFTRQFSTRPTTFRKRLLIALSPIPSAPQDKRAARDFPR